MLSHASPLPPSLAAQPPTSVSPEPLCPYLLGLVLSPALPDEPTSHENFCIDYRQIATRCSRQSKIYCFFITRSIWKMLGPFATASRFTLSFTRGHYCRHCRTSPAALMSTTTTMTTRDRGDRYGPMEWAQWSTAELFISIVFSFQDTHWQIHCTNFSAPLFNVLYEDLSKSYQDTWYNKIRTMNCQTVKEACCVFPVQRLFWQSPQM